MNGMPNQNNFGYNNQFSGMNSYMMQGQQQMGGMNFNMNNMNMNGQMNNNFNNPQNQM